MGGLVIERSFAFDFSGRGLSYRNYVVFYSAPSRSSKTEIGPNCCLNLAFVSSYFRYQVEFDIDVCLLFETTDPPHQWMDGRQDEQIR